MARIKPGEIKEGDDLQSSTINSTQDSVREVQIAHANVRQEGLTADVIKPNTVFGDPETLNLRLSQLNDTLGTPTSYTTSGMVKNTDGDVQYISLTDVLGDKKEKVIVRASCRILMDDYGARTFNDAYCPIISMNLRYSEEASGAAPGNYIECDGTLQNFELAWSGKIPSSAVAYTETFGSNRAFNSAYVGSGGSHDGGVHEFYLHSNTKGRNFFYDFTYQSSWLYQPNSKQDQVHFSLFSYAQVPQPEMPPSSWRTTGGNDGCYRVIYDGFVVRYMHLSAVRVKR